ncbi:YkuD_like domain containing protein [Acidimicrobiia bacterium]
MTPTSPNRILRLVGALGITLALVAGAGACSGSDKAGPEDTTTESISGASTTVQAATVKGKTITVVSAAPAGVKTSAPAVSTTIAPNALPAIPRNGLNSAGVKKTADGFEFTNPTYFKNPLVFEVLEKSGDWLKVLIPARPNQTEGWIKASDVTLETVSYRMVLNLSKFQLIVYKGSEVFIETDVVIGKDSTRTPVGRFYMTEKIKQSNDTGIYGSWVLATNGYSESLDTFNDGLPVIAFHGTNQPELVGTKASNGCVRMTNEVVSKLADALPAGTPIDIISGT